MTIGGTGFNPICMEKQWFVIHTYSGYENKVKTNLERRVESMGMSEDIFRILVPMEDEVQVKDGKKKIVKKKIFPGYVLVEMCMTDDSWYVVRNTPGVTGFVGAGAKPIPMSDNEAQFLLRRMGSEEENVSINFTLGEVVRIISGPFEGFEGILSEVLKERKKVKVTVSMFGRETPVELDYFQIAEL